MVVSEEGSLVHEELQLHFGVAFTAYSRSTSVSGGILNLPHPQTIPLDLFLISEQKL
jgi:hypothetical protein